MQQMTNILLSSAEPTAKKLASSSPSEPTAESDNFAAALDKASKDGATDVENLAGKPKLDASSAEPAVLDIKDSSQAAEAEQSDDVSQVLAQINLANSFPAAADSEPAIAADGEPLPQQAADGTEVLDLAISQSLAEDKTDIDQNKDIELTDDVLQALSLQSGLSKQELQQLPAAELEALLAQSKLLDADGNVLAQYVVAPAVVTEAVDSAANNKQSRATEFAAIGQSSVVDKEAKAVNNSHQPATLAQQSVDPNGKIESRDILGKEAAIQAGTATANLNPGASQNVEIENGNSAKAVAQTNPGAIEQLKGAELSVKLSPIQMGLEANLASGNEELATQDIKTVSGLQAHNLQMQQSLTRIEPQQIQLALKQHADQASQMQEMIQRFSPVMKQQLMTMVSQGVQQAEIRLDPAELGSMMVRIQVQGDTTQVQFQVSQHQTRDIVEQAMPRLREMLAEQGMQLTDGQVSQDDRGSEQSFQGDAEAQAQSGSEMDEFSAEELIVGANQATSVAQGIDYYA